MTCMRSCPARPIVCANRNAPSYVVPSPAMVVLVRPSILGQLGAASPGARHDATSAAIGPHGAREVDGGGQREQRPRWTTPPPARRRPSPPNNHFRKRLDRDDLATLLSAGVALGRRRFRVVWGGAAPLGGSLPQELDVQQVMAIAWPDCDLPRITEALLVPPS